ncbi:MAG: hypothetical protein NT131_08130 [Methanomassiliicoccales archaeon]|nr:hypothetical protein [Methanomassiliicoccales archaeon]
MTEANSEMLSFAADALHTNALATSKDVAFNEVGAGYYGLRLAIMDVGRSCLTPGSRVVDLRCDLPVLMPLVLEHEDLCKFVVLSPTADESWKCFDRLRARVRAGFVDATCLDLREGFPEVSARMMLSLQALGELSEGRRAKVLESMRRRLEKGGAAIFMERVEEEAGPQVRRKRPSLSAKDWEALLTSAGFSSINRIWSDGESVAWVLRK